MKRIATLLSTVLLIGMMQIPAHAADKVITPLGKVATADKGKTVTVQGSVTGERKFKSGMRYTLDDGTGKITLVVFDKELKQVPKRDSLATGAMVNVTGRVDFYKGVAEIVPARGTDVIVVSAAPVLTPTTIGAASKGATVLVQGVVSEAANFSAGFKLVVNDGSGQIGVTLFDKTFDTLADVAKMNVGATLRVSGPVDEYRGALEIVPNSVTVVEVKARSVPTHTLGAISGNDDKAVVQVEGDVTSVTPFADGVDVLVADATGAQNMRLWNVVAKRVKVKTGDHVVVIGRVKASKKGIEIDVAMPSDIQIKK